MPGCCRGKPVLRPANEPMHARIALRRSGAPPCGVDSRLAGPSVMRARSRATLHQGLTPARFARADAFLAPASYSPIDTLTAVLREFEASRHLRPSSPSPPSGAHALTRVRVWQAGRDVE